MKRIILISATFLLATGAVVAQKPYRNFLKRQANGFLMPGWWFLLV
jgi:hypothetical protein